MLIDNVDFLKRIMWNNMGFPFAFDIETSGLDERKDRIVGLALTFSEEESYYIVIEHTIPKEDGHALHNFISYENFQRVVAPFFAQPDVLMVSHNGKFEYKFFFAAGIPINGRLYDTMLAAHELDEERESYSLKDLSKIVGVEMSKYLEMEHYPGFTKEEILGVPLDLVADYAMKDTLATWRLYKKFSKEIAQEGLEDHFNKIVMPLLPVLAQMETRGVAIDIPKVQELKIAYDAKVLDYERRVEQEGIKMLLSKPLEDISTNSLRMATVEELENVYTNEDGVDCVDVNGMALPVIIPTPRSKPRLPIFNPNSGQQLEELLFGYYKLQPPTEFRMKKKKDGTNSVDKKMLETMGYELGEKAPAALKDVLALRKASKFTTTYLNRFLTASDPDDFNSLRTTLNQHRTKTGRLSSTEPNLLNISARGQEGKDARGVFIARPQHKLIVGDFAAFELRMLAHYSKDTVLRRAFIEGLDLHTMTAASQTGRTYEEMKELIESGDDKAKKDRQIGKTSNFGLTYGMGDKAFQIYLLVEAGIYLPIAEISRLTKSFHEAWPEATEWKQRVIKKAHKLGYIKTICGRKRRLPNLSSYDRYLRSEAERQGVNAVIQGSCADMIAMTMPAIQNAISPFGGSLLLQIYDELVLEAPEQYADLCARLTEDIITGMLNPLLTIPLEFEANVGDSWLDAK